MKPFNSLQSSSHELCVIHAASVTWRDLHYFQDTKCAVKISELLRDFYDYNVVKRGLKVRIFLITRP